MCWRRQTKAASLPSILTVSMGWDDRPWGGKAGWRLTREQFAELCGPAKMFLQKCHAGRLADRMVLVGNWNEFGEGHHVAPHRQYGFGYLDAIWRVFSPTAKPPRDLVPEDVGLGPYDSLFRAAQTR